LENSQSFLTKIVVILTIYGWCPASTLLAATDFNGLRSCNSTFGTNGPSHQLCTHEAPSQRFCGVVTYLLLDPEKQIARRQRNDDPVIRSIITDNIAAGGIRVPLFVDFSFQTSQATA
jgi:hypothetical protein